jgi:DNA-binding MarR family transcriptional regulator
MIAKHPSDPYKITWLIRRLFRAMAQNTNERLAHLGITAADRAVLEFLYPDKALAVPEIAIRYQVSRQHVQTTVNRLFVQKLLLSKTNPQHKRSPLIILSAKGRNLFASIREADEDVLCTAFAGISRHDVATTENTLNALLEKLG